MFRELTRKKQQLSQEDSIQLLKTQPRGVLSLLGDGGYPYGLPMDHWYNEEDGCLYFHSSPRGHKIDSITACPKASFCVFDQGYRKDGDWPLHIQSVIVFGHMEIVEDHALAMEMVRQLGLKFTQDLYYLEKEIAAHGHRVLILKLVPEQITGKLVKES